MRALEPEVVDVIWQTIEPLLPDRVDEHPLGCHRLRVADRLCFWGILIRLVTGSSWVDIEAILGRPIVATVPYDVAISRAVDSGLLTTNIPRIMARALRHLVPTLTTAAR